jgi:DNA-binding winged helix-turn-helix (wHTH) protein
MIMTKPPVATFHPGSETVTLGEKTVQLNHPAATCLHLLISRQGEIVNKEDILNACWAERGVIVSDVSVRQVLFQLRKALQEAGLEAGCLANVQRKGYRLAAGSIVISEQRVPEAAPEFLPEIKGPDCTPEERVIDAPADGHISPLNRQRQRDRGLSSRLWAAGLLMGSLITSYWIYTIRTAELIEPVAYDFVTKVGDAEVFFQREGEINREIVLTTLQTLISKKYITPSLNRFIYVNQTYTNSIVTLFACRAPLSEPDNRCYSLVAEDRK